MSDQQKVVHGLSNGAIFNDLEQPLAQISKSHHYLMLLSQKQYEIHIQQNTNRDLRASQDCHF